VNAKWRQKQMGKGYGFFFLIFHISREYYTLRYGCELYIQAGAEKKEMAPFNPFVLLLLFFCFLSFFFFLFCLFLSPELFLDVFLLHCSVSCFSLSLSRISKVDTIVEVRPPATGDTCQDVRLGLFGLI
jgi:hypothetical protein